MRSVTEILRDIVFTWHNDNKIVGYYVDEAERWLKAQAQAPFDPAPELSAHGEVYRVCGKNVQTVTELINGLVIGRFIDKEGYDKGALAVHNKTLYYGHAWHSPTEKNPHVWLVHTRLIDGYWRYITLPSRRAAERKLARLARKWDGMS